MTWPQPELRFSHQRIAGGGGQLQEAGCISVFSYRLVMQRSWAWSDLRPPTSAWPHGFRSEVGELISTGLIWTGLTSTWGKILSLPSEFISWTSELSRRMKQDGVNLMRLCFLVEKLYTEKQGSFPLVMTSGDFNIDLTQKYFYQSFRSSNKLSNTVYCLSLRCMFWYLWGGGWKELRQKSNLSEHVLNMGLEKYVS